MALLSPIVLLINAIGADIKALRTNSATMAINAATRLIQTQRIIASQVANQTAL